MNHISIRAAFSKTTIIILLSFLHVVALTGTSAAYPFWVGDQTTEPNDFTSLGRTSWAAGSFWEGFRPAGLDNAGLPQVGDDAIIDAQYDPPGEPLPGAGYELSQGGTIHFGDVEYSFLSTSSSFRRVGVDQPAVHPTPSLLRVRNGDWTFDFGPFDVAAGDSGSLDVQAQLLVADNNDTNASLTVQNGHLHNGFVTHLAAGQRSVATVIVQGSDALWTTDSYVDLGWVGAGTVRVKDGAAFNPGQIMWIGIDQDAVGRLEILTGGEVQNLGGAVLGRSHSMSQGYVVVDGAGSLWETSIVTVGGVGRGHVSVLNGGSVSAQSIVVADGVTANTWDGEITVSGAGSTLTVLGTGPALEDDLIIGRIGDGAVAVANGGAVTVVGEINVGHLGNGTLSVLSGGSVHLNDLSPTDRGILRVNHGEVIVSGAGSELSGSRMLLGSPSPSGTSSSGNVEIENQASVDFGFLVVGNAVGSSGTMSVSGAAHLATTDASVTMSAISNGEVTIAGNGTRWDSVHAIQVATSFTGTLGISDGAIVESRKGVSPSGTSGAIGNLATANGTVTINGSGSRWTQDGTMVVGWSGIGALAITNGGRLESEDGSIAKAVGSNGSAEISDANSVWKLTRSLYVGGDSAAAGGVGTLTVATNGAVTVADTLKLWSAGTINVSGGGRAVVGLGVLPAAGTLSVASGGILSGKGTVIGNVVVDGGSGAYVGAILPGNSTGILTINGNLTQASSSLLEIEVGGVTPGTQHDKLVVTGNAAIGGQLDVPIVNGYMPQVGDSMTILTAANVTGEFSGLFAPELQAANPNVAIGLNQTATEVQINFVAPITTTQFTSSDPVVDWTDSSAWSTGVEPDSRHVITIENTMAANQSVDIQNDDAFVHDLVVKGDSTHAVTLNVTNERTLSATVSVRAVRATVVVGDPTTIGRVIAPNTDLRDGARLESKRAKFTAQTIAGNVADSRRTNLSNRRRDLRRGSGSSLAHAAGDEPLELGSIVAPGLSVPGEHIGQIEVVGNYEQDEDSFLEMEIESLTSFDKFIVTDESLLAGTLDVSFLNSFTPQTGNSFDLFDWGTVVGDFDVLHLPLLSGGLTWNIDQLYTLGTLAVGGLRGDYNFNGVVDAADYVVWRRATGQTGAGLAADGSGPSGTPDGVVDQLDYDFWRANFGNTAAAAGGTVDSTSAVPEPGGLALVLIGSLAFMPRQRKRVLDECRLAVGSEKSSIVVQ